MTLQSLLNDFNDSIDLCYSYCTDVLEFRYSLFALRDATGNDDGFFYLFSLTNHIDESSLGRIDHSAAVDEDEVGFFGILNHVVAILCKLSNHELAVGNIVRATKSFNEDAVGAWSFFTYIR